MTTPQHIIDDIPIQIIFLDNNLLEGRAFFERGLGTTWFDYDLHMIEDISDADHFLNISNPDKPKPDLLLISNASWLNGGEQLVVQVRSHPTLENMPVYCVNSCHKKRSRSDTQCWDKQWRIETDCDDYAEAASVPFGLNLRPHHPARLDGTICANNIAIEIPRIIDNMTSYWFRSG